MPKLSEQRREEIIIKMWDNLLRVAIETIFITSLSEEDFNRRITVYGLEHLQALQGKGNAGIIFSGHFGNWEIAPRIISSQVPMALVYRSANNKIVDKIINGFRAINNIVMIPKGRGGVKQLITSIKRELTIAMLVDQKMNEGVAVPFFGRDAMTADAIARFALDYKRSIVPMVMKRTKGVNFEIHILAPLVVSTSGDKEQDIYNILLQINRQLEYWITKDPEQWFWLHRRWPPNKSD
jgi:KDO2-lipid IV(A) lauroyltransferase